MASAISLQRSVYGSVLSVIFILLSAACHREDPGVSDLQIGTEGSRDAFVGQELPIAAHILANAPIDHVNVEIQPVSGEGWAFTQQYTEGVAGVKHAMFKAVVAVPATAEAGDYALVLRIKDAEGGITEDTAGFKLAIDSTVPTASDLDVGINAAGNDLHLESELTAPLGIAKVVVEIKGDSWADEFTFSGKELVGQLTHRFHEHVKVGDVPKGTYAVNLVVIDQKGRQFHTVGSFTK